MATIDELRADAKQRQAPRSAIEALRADAAARADPPGIAEDVAKSLAAGATRGAAELVGLPGTLQDLVDAGLKSAGIIPEDTPGSMLSGRSMRSGLESLTGGASERQAATLPGEYAETVGEFLPGAAVGGGGLSALAKFGALPGLASEAAGQLTEGTGAEPYARFGAGLLAPAAAGGAQRLAAKVVSPGGGADPARLAAARTLEAQGVRPTAGQVTGLEPQLYREAATAAGRDLAAQGSDDFTAAALRTIGVDAKRATPDVMDAATQRIGGVFNDVASRTSITPGQATVSRMTSALDEYKALAPAAEAPPLFSNIGKAIGEAAAKSDVIDGRQFQAWRSQLGKLKTSPNPATRAAANEMTDALDEALQISAASSGNSVDVTRLVEARSQYRNLLAIENAVSRAGKDAASGVITPQALRSAVLQQGRRSYVQGKGDLAQLARAGTQVMERLPQSGTQPRLTAGQILPGASGGTATGLGAVAVGADPITAAGMGLLAAVAPAARNRALATGAGQAYMRNQLMGAPAQQKISDYLKTIPGLLAQ